MNTNENRYERSLNALSDASLVIDGENIHIARVVVNAGGTIYTIDGNGLNISQGEPTGRGVSLFTEFIDEVGNGYLRQEQFHKGEVLSRTERASIDDTKQDVWRD